MGDMSVEWQLDQDAKHLAFVLSRYKFVAKMFDGYSRVLEVGCGNGFGGRIVRQSVGELTQVDLPDFDLRRHALPGFDGVFALDVLEHIAQEYENDAVHNLSLCAEACVIGTPSLESQMYASPQSVALHVNCMTGEYLRELCERHFKHVFMFGMNDEVVHTGFLPMSHYLIALCLN